MQENDQTMKEKRNQDTWTEQQLLLPKPADSTASVSFSLFLHRMCRIILPSGRISPPLLSGCRIITYQDEEGYWHQDKIRYLIDINNLKWNRGGRI